MRLRDFYTFITNRLDREKLGLAQFVNPLSHPTLGVQFIHPSGFPHTPLIKNADTILAPDPLAGPFYDLPVAGLIPFIHDDGLILRVVVSMSDGSMYDTGPIYLTSVEDSEIKGLASELGIKWYRTDFEKFPREYFEMPTFDDCVRHGQPENTDENRL